MKVQTKNHKLDAPQYQYHKNDPSQIQDLNCPTIECSFTTTRSDIAKNTKTKQIPIDEINIRNAKAQSKAHIEHFIKLQAAFKGFLLLLPINIGCYVISIIICLCFCLLIFLLLVLTLTLTLTLPNESYQIFWSSLDFDLTAAAATRANYYYGNGNGKAVVETFQQTSSLYPPSYSDYFRFNSKSGPKANTNITTNSSSVGVFVLKLLPNSEEEEYESLESSSGEIESRSGIASRIAVGSQSKQHPAHHRLAKRLVGGQSVEKLSQASGFVVQLIRRHRTVCTGSLISTRLVLTAAHCTIKGIDGVVVGTVERFRRSNKASNSNRRRTLTQSKKDPNLNPNPNQNQNFQLVRAIYRHPAYDQEDEDTWWHDLALIQLDKPIVILRDFSRNSSSDLSEISDNFQTTTIIRPIALDSRDDHLRCGSPVKVYGFGREVAKDEDQDQNKENKQNKSLTVNNGNSRIELQKQQQTKYQKNKKRKKRRRKKSNNNNNNKMMQVMSTVVQNRCSWARGPRYQHYLVTKAGNRTVCHGDSGGPLVGANGRLFGVTSRSFCLRGRRDLFVKVALHMHFITKHLSLVEEDEQNHR